MTALTPTPLTATLGEDALADVCFAWSFHDTRSPAQRLAEARRLFIEKFGSEPTYCLCNDQTAAVIGPESDGMRILGRSYVHAYELRLGAPGGAG